MRLLKEMDDKEPYGIKLSRVLTFAEVLRHPHRALALLVVWKDGPLSAIEMREARPISSLGSLSYHLRELEALGMIEETGQGLGRGGLKHLYEVTDLGVEAIQVAWLSSNVRQATYDPERDTAHFVTMPGIVTLSDEREWGMIHFDSYGEAMGADLHEASELLPRDLLGVLSAGSTEQE